MNVEHSQANERIEYYFSRWFSLLPIILFIAASIYIFVVHQSLDMIAVAMVGFIGLLITCLFAKNKDVFWNGVVKGMSSEMAQTLILILFIVAFFGNMMTSAEVAEGFVWLGYKLNLSGAFFTAFTFVACALLAAATGTSIGTIQTMFPLLYPAGLILGSSPTFLAGAIVSGALFGDSVGPVSDVTITSVGTQKYRNIKGHPSIMGMVISRLPYALVAGAVSLVIFLFFGGRGEAAGDVAFIEQFADPRGLIMLIPVVILIYTAIKTQNIYFSVAIGTLSGTIIGLIAGVITPNEIFIIEDGVASGFLINAINGPISTIIFLIALFGIIGVIQESGTMEEIIERLAKSKLGRTKTGTELIIIFGTVLSGFSFGGLNGPAVLFFGPVANDLGKKHELHPYRIGNLVSLASSSLGIIVPWSLFIIIANATIAPLAEQYDFLESISLVDIGLTSVHCFMLFAIVIIAAVTGWQRRYEGPNGEELKERPYIHGSKTE